MSSGHPVIHRSPSSSVFLPDEPLVESPEEDIRLGLTGSPKWLPSRLFYDSAGSALFEHITELPEYYLTRVEQGLLASLADELMARACPEEVIELGSGSSAKISSLLNTPSATEHLTRYVPFDVNRETVQSAINALANRYPLLQIRGIVGNFEKHLEYMPPRIGSRLIIFLGSTMGNLDPLPRHQMLLQLKNQLAPGDRLLLGLDLIKDQSVLEAAYNDTQGITAEFNRNILRVINRSFHSDFQPEAFRHSAYYNREANRIEMHLSPASPQTVNLTDLNLTIRIQADETIWTENSYKFTRGSTEAMLEEAGLHLDRWYTDSNQMFALALGQLN